MTQALVEQEKQAILTQALEIAQQAAYDAGTFLREKQGYEQVLYKKARRDAVLDVDIEAEQRIIAMLRAYSPDYDILSEETPQDTTNSPNQWVIDPLDGSFNFHHHSPVYGISIGLRVHHRVEVAVVYLPFYNEMFTAIHGQGAYLNGEPIQVSSLNDLDEASVHVGDFTKDVNPGENQIILKDIAHLANTVGRVRMIGTAATDLAYIACGRADALVVHNALPWDIEVGALLITEAGGKVEFLEDPQRKKLTICSNGQIHTSLFTIIRDTRSDVEYGAICQPSLH